MTYAKLQSVSNTSMLKTEIEKKARFGRIPTQASRRFSIDAHSPDRALFLFAHYNAVNSMECLADS